ncbi:Phosphoserine phosphatase RsbP [Streptomyces sp. YIM 130001]|uniref:PP2C family protein-serine/threonine phosphatase n=1 Tax=Streptomyces sp. YIM 130001 TaxID=2259644 RepID=UPI000E65B2A6|nr:PP2C family protein-serine/threonine phosphatase [Streptomyces sp. YIM 130001]RII17127.1 Phosphoserine phosphatase RsbP [Streptomyces sp. YIM 130001]
MLPWKVTRRDGTPDEDLHAGLRGAPPIHSVRRALPVLLILTALLRIFFHLDTEFALTLAATPPVAALSYGPLATAGFGAVAILLFELPLLQWDTPGTGDFGSLLFVVLLSVAVSWVRKRREDKLFSIRTVAESAQLAVLTPLAERVGEVRCSGLYRAAARDSRVGGDLFDVRDGPYGVRAVVGDVQGHGLAAVGTVAALLGAFRESVLDDPDLERVAARLDRRMVIDSEGVEHAELFATALLMEFPPGSSVVRLLSCGHPAPLMLRDGRLVEPAVQSSPPLGLGLSLDGIGAPVVRTVELEAGDVLVAFSDGVTEARDASGAYYPLEERLPALGVTDPDRLAEAVWQDLRRFVRRIEDDLQLLVLAPDLQARAEAGRTQAGRTGGPSAEDGGSRPPRA